MELEFLLNEEIQRNPEKYSEDAIRRVSELVQIMGKNPEKISYKKFMGTEDYCLFYNINPDLKGKNTTALQKGNSNQKRFYNALYYQARKESNGDKKFQKELMISVLTCLMGNRYKYATISDIENYFNLHPEMKGKNTVEMQKIPELRDVYNACWEIAIKKSKGDKRIQYAFMRKIFPQLREAKAHFTLKDWQEKHDEIPEWKKMSSIEIRRDKKNRGTTFYLSFNTWANVESKGDRAYKKFLVNQVYNRK